jgi:hypothetical protein
MVFSGHKTMQNVTAKTHKIIYNFIKELGKSKQRNITAAVTALIKQEKPTLFKLNLYKHRTTNIQKLSFEQNSRRFLDKIGFNTVDFAYQIFSTFNITSFELVIDRTNWNYGNCDFNLLVLSVIWNNISIPIYWISIGKNGGNSDSLERISLINWFVSNFSANNIIHILADREFPSEEFIQYLEEHNIKFIFRTKSSIIVTNNNKKTKLKSLFPDLNKFNNKAKTESFVRRAYNHRLFLSTRLNQRNEFVYIISNQFDKNNLDLYRRRWTIEAMFAKFKTKGLNLESTHLMKSNRVHNLFYLMTIAYSIFCKIGHFANKIKPIKTKNHNANNQNRISPEFSLFNLGFYLLKNLYDNFLCDKVIIVKQLYQILNYPPNRSIPKRLAIYHIIANF